MKRIRVLALAIMALAAIVARAQTMTVSGSNIEDSSGAKCSSCTIQFAPVNNGGVALSYQMGGGGQVLSKPVQATVASGAFSVSLPDTSKTNPANVCFAVTVTENLTGSSVLGPGYSCVQPSSASAQAAWCTSSACNFDSYIPSTPALTVTTAGPPGPTGCLETSGNCSNVVMPNPTGSQAVTQPAGTTLSLNNVAISSGNVVMTNPTASQAVAQPAGTTLSLNNVAISSGTATVSTLTAGSISSGGGNTGLNGPVPAVFPADTGAVISSGQYVPQFDLWVSAAPQDEKISRFICRNNGGCQFQAISDAFSGEVTIFEWTRTGTTPSAVKFDTGVVIPSIAAASGTRYVCVDSSGNLVSQTSPCSGT